MKNKLRKIIPEFILNGYHGTISFVGALLYRFPSRKIRVIGITGTNGKSTTVEMMSSVLREAGYKVGLLSSIRFEIAGKSEVNMLKMTMPGRMIVQKMIRKAVNEKCDYMIIEVTSEGIKQNRHLFIDFDVVAITNLTPEHIESHRGFENYKKAKGDLFDSTDKVHIINLDDEHANYFKNFKARSRWGYGIESNEENGLRLLKAKDCKSSSEGISFNVDETDFKIGIPGRFNIYNALAVIAIALSQKIDLETIKRGLGNVSGVAGRMEKITSSPFRVFVDYAFTPNALEKVYQTIKKDFNSGRMICVLGSCGGGRDKWKRPVLGSIAAKYCDEVIITNEDPYDEDPIDIIDQVAKGTGEKAKKIVDRREAIREALSLAQPNDSVIITGKGCEPWICVAGGKKITWDDRDVAREELARLS
jgi:UDP-N-acetylmuramoyl-L-alanyl-D-glutamate--2,6-diaminopimelate ligase